MWESRIKYFKSFKSWKFIFHGTFRRKLQKDAFNQENEPRRRKTQFQKMRANSRGMWKESPGGDCLKSSSLEAEPETGIHVPMIYWGRAFRRKGERTTTQGRGRSKEGCGLSWRTTQLDPMGRELRSIKCTTEMVLSKGKEPRVVFSSVNPALRGSGFNLLVKETPTWLQVTPWKGDICEILAVTETSGQVPQPCKAIWAGYQQWPLQWWVAKVQVCDSHWGQDIQTRADLKVLGEMSSRRYNWGNALCVWTYW